VVSLPSLTLFTVRTKSPVCPPGTCFMVGFCRARVGYVFHLLPAVLILTNALVYVTNAGGFKLGSNLRLYLADSLCYFRIIPQPARALRRALLAEPSIDISLRRRLPVGNQPREEFPPRVGQHHGATTARTLPPVGR
jgi:hypothetical protein